MRVDFPEPFSPAMQCTSPLFTERDTPASAFAPPNDLTIFSTPYSAVTNVDIFFYAFLYSEAV
jgi:hypothetical protein